VAEAWLNVGRTIKELATVTFIVLMARAVGEQVRGNTIVVARHLARLLGEPVGGYQPDEPRDPRNFRHWWREIKTHLKNIRDKSLSPKQLRRELRKRFTEEQIQSIKDALRSATEQMQEEPPEFL